MRPEIDRLRERREQVKEAAAAKWQLTLHGFFTPSSSSKGRIYTAVPFWGRGNLNGQQQEYNDVHGWYRAGVKQLFAQLWQWKIVRHIGDGGGEELHHYIRILLHMEQFVLNSKVKYQPYGPWPHVLLTLWADAFLWSQPKNLIHKTC